MFSFAIPILHRTEDLGSGSRMKKILGSESGIEIKHPGSKTLDKINKKIW
jgi:hypothetical protein